ncbi:alpha/beta hydrolase [Parahaliea aestuarii]
MGSAVSTKRLRDFLRSLGYYTFDWRLGRNTGPVGPTEAALLERVQMIHERMGQKPSLVGWSLGGVYARILAQTHPQHLRSVITLGSPLRYPHQSSADSLYRQASGQFEHPEHLMEIDAAPGIPATSIHSRLDGIVNWRACLSEESATSENIRVYGSHCGLGYQPLVHCIIADRLAQPEGAWERFTWRNLPFI